jgi:hypothetical protein
MGLPIFLLYIGTSDIFKKNIYYKILYKFIYSIVKVI